MTEVTVELSVEMEVDDDWVDWKVWKDAYEKICNEDFSLEDMYINGQPVWGY